MAIENKGPGGVNASYGIRSTANKFDTDSNFDSDLYFDSHRKIVSPNGDVLVDLSQMAPSATGNDDTALLQNFFDQMSALALASGSVLRVVFPANQEYLTQGNFLRSNLDIDFNGATLVKTANNSGNMFTSNTVGVLRTGPWVKTNGSWYGQADNITIRNVVLDSNNKWTLGVLELYGVRHFRAHNVTLINGQWNTQWTLRGAGRNAKFFDLKILGAAHLYQDGFHWEGGDCEVQGAYIQSGDDAFAGGCDQVNANPFRDDEPLAKFFVRGAVVEACRGAALKGYRAATAPWSGAPNNYSQTRYVRGFDVELGGKSGILRNGGISMFNHSAAGSRIRGDIRDAKIHANLEIGTDGKGVWSAVAGTLIGNPSSVTQATPPVVTLNGHGLTAGKVVHFVPDIGGMNELNNFYQVLSPATNTFTLSESPFQTSPLVGAGFNAWTGGKLLLASSGSGYAVGQDISPVGGTYTRPAVFRITQVDANGAVEALRRIDEGDYSVLPPAQTTATGGTGTGCNLFLYLQHDGVNAYGSHMVGAMDIEVTGRLNINDTTGAATRFRSFDHDDSTVRFFAAIPKVPAGGGLIGNSSSEQLSIDNVIDAHMVCNGALNSSISPIMLSNSENTVVKGRIENLPANTVGVVFPVSGNTLANRAIAGITGATNSTFAVAHGNWRAGQIARISGNVLSAGSLDGYYIIRQIYDGSSLALRTFAGAQVGLGAATVSTLGTIEVANNTAKISGLRITPATNAVGTVGVSAASASPVRVAALTIEDSDLSAMATPIGTNVQTLPGGYVSRDNKV